MYYKKWSLVNQNTNNSHFFEFIHQNTVFRMSSPAKLSSPWSLERKRLYFLGLSENWMG